MDSLLMYEGPCEVLTFRWAVHSLVKCKSQEMYLDRPGAIKLAKTLDALSPRPVTLELMYLTFGFRATEQPGYFRNEDFLIDRLSAGIFQHVKTRRGRDLYRIVVSTVQQYIERMDLEWRVFYEPGEELDLYLQDIREYQNENPLQLSWLCEPYYVNQQHNFAPYTTAIPQTQQLTVAPQQLVLAQQPFQPQHATVISQFTLGSMRSPEETIMADATPQMESIMSVALSQQETLVESGYPTPTDGSALQTELGGIAQGMDRQCNQSTPRQPFRSAFDIAEEQSVDDNKAALQILKKMRVLAVNPRIDKYNKHRFSIFSEKKYIQSMSIDDTLNIGSSDWTISEKMEKLFNKFHKHDEEGQESFHRALLMIVVHLLRHKFIYENGKKQPGNYAIDFEKTYKLPSGYLRTAGHLCKIVVACGHPCIIVVLVRMAIRNNMTLSKLLDQLPINHFCRYIATGKVTDFNYAQNDNSAHKDLQWLHRNVLLPLLQAASCRVRKQLSLVNGSLVCDEESCLRAIVHHSQQNKYGQFLDGDFLDNALARGKVLIENRNINQQTAAEFSVEREDRTFHRFKLSQYAHTDHFDNPPKFLQSQTLEMSLDV